MNLRMTFMRLQSGSAKQSCSPVDVSSVACKAVADYLLLGAGHDHPSPRH